MKTDVGTREFADVELMTLSSLSDYGQSAVSVRWTTDGSLHFRLLLSRSQR